MFPCIPFEVQAVFSKSSLGALLSNAAKVWKAVLQTEEAQKLSNTTGTFCFGEITSSTTVCFDFPLLALSTFLMLSSLQVSKTMWISSQLRTVLVIISSQGNGKVVECLHRWFKFLQGNFPNQSHKINNIRVG